MPPTPNEHVVATTLRSLKRVDPGITRTIAQAAYVVAYLAGQRPGEWDRMGVEGTLFVYER